MTDVKYNYNWVLDAKAQREADPIEDTPKGIAAKPAEQGAPDEKNFLEKMYDRLVGGFTDEEEAIDAMSSKKPSREAAQASVLDEMEELARQSAEEAALYRMEQGITQSLSPYAPRRSIRPPSGTKETTDAFKAIEEPAPVTVEELDAAPTGGLMSPTAEEDETVTETDTFATLITSAGSETVDSTVPLTAGFDSLTEAEGTDIHLDGRGFVTLPYGIVPDSGSVKKADGTTFDPTGSHGLSASQLSDVDYSGATKFGLSRADYDSDEAFAKAVYAEFGNRTATSYGEGFDDLTDEAKQAAYDMAWNAGIGSAGWSSVQTMLTEASKDGDKSKDSLIGFTTNFRSGTDYPRGLLKRRLQTYNLVANEGEAASVITTTAAMKDGKRTGTIYTIKDADGGVLKTWTKPDLNEVLGDLEVPQ